jgi:hypothetical protein
VNELDRVREEGGLNLAYVEQEPESFWGVKGGGTSKGGPHGSATARLVVGNGQPLVTLLRPRLSQTPAAAEADDRQSTYSPAAAWIHYETTTAERTGNHP